MTLAESFPREWIEFALPTYVRETFSKYLRTLISTGVVAL
jgi:hypothetical protein